MFKQVLITVMLGMALAPVANSHAAVDQPQTRTQATLQKQFTLNVAGLDLKGLDSVVDKVHIECRIQKRDASHFDQWVLGSATIELPVTQHAMLGGSIQSGPLALEISVGDGFHNAPAGSGANDAHVWRCRLQLHKEGGSWENVEPGSSGYCRSDGWKWKCSLPGSPLTNYLNGQF